MAEETYRRRLTAILSADVAGYSRLMQDDEEATVRTLTAFRHAVTHLIEKYRGRVVDSPGDNLLAEFTSVVDAVNCAVEIQREMAERNAELPDNRKMQFRIGINLGDVIEEGNRIYGDGVNIAARMEGLAEVGEICISGTVYDAIENKIGLQYEYRGEHTVKNIDKPIRAYKVLSFPGAAAHRVIKAKKAAGMAWQNVVVSVIAALVAGTAFLVWQFQFRPPDIEPASVEEMAFPLPEKPSIAVLPFVNMSGDPKKEYICDGITEQIITSLSKNPNIFVISRTSTFSYKNKPVKIQLVAEELGVQYVLEGSIQQSEDKIRITAQLIDALTGRHVWSKRYERDYQELFALQDEITLKILRELHVTIASGERARLMYTAKPVNIAAYEKTMEAAKYIRAFNPESNATAKRLLQESMKLDPDFYANYNALAIVHVMDVWLGMSKSPGQSLDQAIELCQQAISLNENDAVPYSTLCLIYSMKRQYEKAIAAGKKAIEISPNSDRARVWLAMALRYVGKAEEAIKLHQQANRLCPFPPNYYYLNLGHAFLSANRCEEAIQEYQKTLHLAPRNFFAFFGLSVGYGLLGREEKSRAAAEEMMNINPRVTIQSLSKNMVYKDRDMVERWMDALRKAGVPEA